MFRTAIIKLTAFCNLNCSYCYMFNQRDMTYARIPKHLPAGMALLCLDRIQEHLNRHRQTRFDIVLHGGEPTLWPLASFKRLFRRLETINRAGADLRVTVQSNGLRIREALLDLFAEHGVAIGISIDGPRDHNDRWRVNHAGAGSYDRIMSSVQEIIEKGRGDLLGGFLCVAPVSVPPAEFLEWIDQLPVRNVDVLWPMEFHHGNPPWGESGREAYLAYPRIGSWFAELFSAWWQRDDPALRIRLFEACVGQLLGARQHGDNIVNDALPSFVLNTDGGIEYHDFFRSHADGACRTKLNIASDPLDALAADPGFDFCLHLGEHLPAECRGCPHQQLCGGGFLPGRFQDGEALPVRRSILCADQFYFFASVKRLVAPFLAARPCAAV